MSIAERWAAAEAARPTAPVNPHNESTNPQYGLNPLPGGKFRHYKPFVNAVDAYVAEARDGERIYFGVPEFDSQIRGVGRGQLCIINGYSHSGKTLFITHILLHNRDKRIVLFTPDEPAQLVLAKLAAACHGVSADEIEDRIAAGDEQAVELLRQTALAEFPNLIVFDKPLRGEDMEAAMKEAELVWGAKAEAVALDYLELLQAGETVMQKGEFVKAFCSKHEVPFFLLHQTSRSGGADGKKQTISSGAYGGETLATFQLGVWRKKAACAAELIEVNDRIMRAVNGATDQMLDRQATLQHELERAEYTLTVAITKNKRPGRREGREEIDFELFGGTGLLSPLGVADIPVQYRQRLQQLTDAAKRQAQVQGHRSAEQFEEQRLLDDDTFYKDVEQW